MCERPFAHTDITSREAAAQEFHFSKMNNIFQCLRGLNFWAHITLSTQSRNSVGWSCFRLFHLDGLRPYPFVFTFLDSSLIVRPAMPASMIYGALMNKSQKLLLLSSYPVSTLLLSCSSDSSSPASPSPGTFQTKKKKVLIYCQAHSSEAFPSPLLASNSGFLKEKSFQILISAA